MAHIEEAKKLSSKISKAIAVMNSGGEEFEESEVKFRSEAIRGVLIMARNDVQAMLKSWQEEG